MIIKEDIEVSFDWGDRITFFDSQQPITLHNQRKVIKKTIRYDTDPAAEIQGLVDDGWTLTKIESNRYYNASHYNVTMTRVMEESFNIPTSESPLRVDELQSQISILFDDKWDDI